MNTKKTLLASLFAVLFTSTSSAEDVTNKQEIDSEVEIIEVTGFRGSITSAAAVKRSSSQVTDSISANDMGKFPDTNIGESLQRIPGIQIQRSRGEASGIAIRGLDEVATMLNGRNYFGGGTNSGVNRFASLEDIPPVIVSAVNVYKSSAADQIEGGIGGVVDIIRRRASDLEGFTFAANANMQYGDLVDEWSPKVSALIGNVWEVGGDDELSALFAISYQDREYREDLSRSTGFAELNGDINGQSVPAGTLRTTGLNSAPAWGSRERTVMTGSLEWEAGSNARYYVEGGYTDYADIQNREELVLGNFGAIESIDFSNVDSNTPFPNSISYDDLRFDVLSMIDSRETSTYDLAAGFEITSGDFKYSSEISVVNTENDGAFRNMRLRDNWDKLPVTVDHSNINTAPPSFDFGSFDPANSDNFNIVQWRHESRQYDADEQSARFDVTYTLQEGIISSIDFGLRYSQLDLSQTKQNQMIRDFGDELVVFTGGDPLSLIGNNQFDNFFSEVDGANFISDFVAVEPSDLISRDAEIRTQYGFSEQGSTQSPLDLFDYEEKSTAVYVKANIDMEIGSMFLSGNFGLRYVKTDTETNGFNQSGVDESGSAIFSPLHRAVGYSEYLPSMNLSLEVTEDVIVRMAASRTLARPHFADLAPSLHLNFAESIGTGGNPELTPFTANNFDAGIEYYFDEGSYVSAIIFYKEVDGFLQTAEELENFNGQDFLIRRKSNGGSGTVEGLELGYQQLLDFLPVKGFGLQVNYTYVDSDVPSPNPELDNISLEGLSDSSYNIVGFYENDTFSARLAYNYRSEYLVTSQYEHTSYKQLDASFSYDFSENLKFTLDGINLLRADSRDYYVENQNNPHNWFATERRVLVGASYTY